MGELASDEHTMERLDLADVSTVGPGTLFRSCRYGENPWQTPAGLYATQANDPLALPRFDQIGRGNPSYVNWCDIDRGLTTLTHIAAAFADGGGARLSIAVVMKHGNACGAGISTNARQDALEGAIDGDPEAAYGGIVLTNFEVESFLGVIFRDHRSPRGVQRVLGGLVAPDIHSDAVEVLRRKDGKGFFLVNPALGHLSRDSLSKQAIVRSVRGGFLVQPNFTFVLDWLNPELRWYGPEPATYQKDNLLLARAVGSTSTSNTITLVKEGRVIANATGQQSRVDACELAVHKAQKAGHVLRNCVAYSDSFFPFPDGPKILIDAGVTAILASSGSIRDQETIKLCEDRGISLCLIPDKLGRGFYGH